MRKTVLQRLIQIATQRRWIVWGSSIILTVALGGMAGTLKMDTRWSTLLPESLPVVQEFTHIGDNFYQPEI